MKISTLIEESFVDGPGIRMTIFFQGCPHHCEGCHNPQTWSEEGGKEVSAEEILKIYQKNPLLSGITFSGGEPFQQRNFKEMLEIANEVHVLNGNIWAYTGYILENLLSKEKDSEIFQNLINSIDTIVDGPFILSKKSLNCPFRGSSNQRILTQKKGKWVTE